MDTCYWLLRSFIWVFLAVRNIGNDVNHRHSLELSAIISFLLSAVFVSAMVLFFVERNTMSVVIFLFFAFVLYHSTGVVFYVLNVETERTGKAQKWQHGGPW